MNTRTETALEEFRRLCRIPHASRHEAAVGQYLRGRLEDMSFPVRTDAVGNLIAEVPARGMPETAPVTVLQAHMDMVLAGTVPPEQAEVHTVLEGDVLRTDGTTSLGADNGIGVAVILALLQDPAFVHGPLRVLFTVSEEIGLYGAQRMPAEWLSGADFMINTDGFHSDTALIGCMSGKRETYSREVEREPAAADAAALQLSFRGFLGGHSGDDIDRGRCNTIIALAGLIRALRDEYPALRVGSFSGGTALNAIPGNAEAVVLLPKAEAAGITAKAKALADALLRPYAETDPNGSFSAEPAECPADCWAEDDGDAVLWMATELYNGVAEREPDGTVASGCNLGRLWEENGTVYVGDMLRCNSAEREDRLAGQHRTVSVCTGFSCSVSGYSGWYGSENGRLACIAKECYQALKGRPIICKRALVGVEPAYFQVMAPQMEIVCLGADIENAHSVKETVRVSGTELMYDLMTAMVRRIGELNA